MSIASMRRRRGYTQEALAALLDVDRSTVGKWEQGVNRPVGKYRRKLCAVLMCTEAELELAPRETNIPQ